MQKRVWKSISIVQCAIVRREKFNLLDDPPRPGRPKAGLGLVMMMMMIMMMIMNKVVMLIMMGLTKSNRSARADQQLFAVLGRTKTHVYHTH